MLREVFVNGLTCMTAMIAGSALANDSVASMKAGNLVFEKSASISMESEDLTITMKKITVKYTFKNLTHKAVTGLVAFPLPQWHGISGYNLPVDEKNIRDNLIHFELKEDGKTRPTEVVVKKMQRPDAPEDAYTLDISYIWQQSFPAGKTITIEHSYDNLTGTGGIVYDGAITAASKQQYCIDESFEKAFHQHRANLKKELSPVLKKDDIDFFMHYHSFIHSAYVLKTGNNWAGPIKKFKLRVIKDQPSTLVSFCWDGIKKVSDTEFVSEKTNFRPSSDLEILFVRKPDDAYEKLQKQSAP